MGHMLASELEMQGHFKTGNYDPNDFLSFKWYLLAYFSGLATVSVANKGLLGWQVKNYIRNEIVNHCLVYRIRQLSTLYFIFFHLDVKCCRYGTNCCWTICCRRTRWTLEKTFQKLLVFKYGFLIRPCYDMPQEFCRKCLCVCIRIRFPKQFL